MTASRRLRVALIGTDSLAGKELKRLLSVIKFPLAGIEFYDADVREEFSKLTQFLDEPKVVHCADPRALDGLDLVFLAGDRETARTFGRLASEKKFRAIDLSGAFSDEPDVPVVVAGVNDPSLDWQNHPLVANPRPAAIVLSALLHRLIEKYGVNLAVAFVLRPASAFNQAGIEELADQSAALLSGASLRKEVFKDQVAFNLLSRTEAPDAGGFSREERQIGSEVRRVLGRPGLGLTLSVVQAPVFHTYSVMAYVELVRPAETSSLESLFRESRLFKVAARSSAGCAISPMSVAGKEQIFIGQIKKDETRPNGFWIWTVTDNLTRGSALNALEIAQRLAEVPAARPARK